MSASTCPSGWYTTWSRCRSAALCLSTRICLSGIDHVSRYHNTHPLAAALLPWPLQAVPLATTRSLATLTLIPMPLPKPPASPLNHLCDFLHSPSAPSICPISLVAVGVNTGPFSRLGNRRLLVVLPVLRDVVGQRVVGIWRAEQRLDREAGVSLGVRGGYERRCRG